MYQRRGLQKPPHVCTWRVCTWTRAVTPTVPLRYRHNQRRGKAACDPLGTGTLTLSAGVQPAGCCRELLHAACNTDRILVRTYRCWYECAHPVRCAGDFQLTFECMHSRTNVPTNAHTNTSKHEHTRLLGPVVLVSLPVRPCVHA